MAVAYPLQAARELREAEVEEAKAALGAATQRLTEAAEARAREEAALAAHEAGTQAFFEQERAKGARSVDALLHAEAFTRRRREERETLRARLAAAQDAERVAAVALGEARDALATAQAEAEAVERHHGAWQAERRREAQRREDDDADDLAMARFAGRPGSGGR